MTADAPGMDGHGVMREHGNAYNIFILVLTIFSLALMVVLLLPLDPETQDLVTFYDNAVCVIFLADFAFNLAGSKPRTAYFIHARGWLDLIGSIPSIGIFQVGALLRLARLSRLARITKLLGGQNRKALIKDVLDNRGSYATFITILAAGMVLTVASILILQFESTSPNANIETGGEALWWGLVTITTVGYGDFYPVTFMGRITAFFVMMAGVGIIGALASILASMLVPPPKSDQPADGVEGATSQGVPVSSPAVLGAPVVAAGSAPAALDASARPTSAPAAAVDPASASAIAVEIAGLRAEIAALRAALPGAHAESVPPA